MQIGWNLIWFIVGVSLLVTVHEFGHFWVARKLGFKVLRFSVGFGKPLYKYVGAAPDHTEYVLAAIPLGGYVRMLDERDGQVDEADRARSFQSKPPWKRILVMLAGPAANFLFAILVLWGMFWVTGIDNNKPVVGDVLAGSPAALAGLRSGDELREIGGAVTRDHGDVALGLLDAMSDDGRVVVQVLGRDGSTRTLTLSVPDAVDRHKLTEPHHLFRGLGFNFWTPPIPALLGEPVPGGPAAAAGLKAGDLVLSADGVRVENQSRFVEYIRARPGQTIVLTLDRKGERISAPVKVARIEEQGKSFGRISIDVTSPREIKFPPEMTTHIALGPIESLQYAAARTWQLTVAQAKFFVRMITGQVSIKNLSGAISIAGYAGDSARAGPDNFIMFLVLISLSLGFLNLLPIPILDGGQVVFQLAEWAKGAPLSDRAYLVGQQAGLAMLVLLMGVALFNDLSGVFAAHP